MKVAVLTHPENPTLVQVITWDGISREMGLSMVQPGTDQHLALKVPLGATETNFRTMLDKRRAGWSVTVIRN